MLTSRRSRADHRGIVLVLVLAMLGLLALVGVTFATYANQAKISNRQYMLSLFQPQAEELIDFGLSQLITDTNDIRSVIRGHSLARDMFGNDATGNAILGLSPTTGLAFSIQQVFNPAAPFVPPVGPGITTPPPTGTLYTLQTNILADDSSFYGYNFTGWIMNFSYAANNVLINGGTGVINQSFQVWADSLYNPSPPAAPNNFRTLTVFINAVDSGNSLLSQLAVTDPTQTDPMVPAKLGTSLYNPTPTPAFPNGGSITQLPGLYIQLASGGVQPLGANTFTLDGRWQHAFNGTGASASISPATGLPSTYYGNYRYSGPMTSPAVTSPGLGANGLPLTPGATGMDEDYDACDLENWFLAIQSADGQVIIPSFHRPAIIRNDLANNQVDDWLRLNLSNNGSTNWADSAARILRPVAADGHDVNTFIDLRPDPNTGQITYDVDNDGDGKTDSVWLDLGYPARRDGSGRLYKPLFAFMVIGLNGRIPLNTSGNLAAQLSGFMPNDPMWAAFPTAGGGPPSSALGGPGHASHLGNSISEVDPTYGLQNAFNAGVTPPTAASPGLADALAAFDPPLYGYLYGGTTTFANNTQVDTAGVDVRLTQLRNLLSGTRSINASGGTINGDTNFVYYSTGPNGQQQKFTLPNGMADPYDVTFVAGNPPVPNYQIDPNTTLPYLVRTTAPVAGRWGEAQSIPGERFQNPVALGGGIGAAFVNVPGINYANPVRAGYSINIRDILSGLPPDSADDNFNTYDPYPLRSVVEPEGGAAADVMINGGEVGDLDYYDSAGALLFPVERMRRWVTPADINGTGAVNSWYSGVRTINQGPDMFGRVEFNSYFRPPGGPGVISTGYTVDEAHGTVTSTEGTNLGAINYPAAGPPGAPPQNLVYYGSGPTPNPATANPNFPTTTPPSMAVPYPYLPDLTSNPLHSLEAGRFPNQAYPVGGALAFTAQQLGGSPAGVTDPAGGPFLNVDSSNGDVPTSLPTYDYYVNAGVTPPSDGLNDADEMNLYQPNPLNDSPFGPGDLEWLYRQQDVDGATLSSRLLQLAPVSFTNGLDGARRRNLYALDSWDLNSFSFTNDNPVGPVPGIDAAGNPIGAFPTNSRINVQRFPFTASKLNGGFKTLGLPTPALAHRDKKINLNYPLPVSNDPNEPVRQKWINDTYQLLKSVLPPLATDTAEELAQLSQYVINIVDFRDTDSTMTHWVNPDVQLAGVPTVLIPTAPPPVVPVLPVPPTLILTGTQWPPAAWANVVPAPPPTTFVQLDQWGMEYNPVAINEVLAYSYLYSPAGGAAMRANRFFIELVNTQTSPEVSAAALAGFNPVLDLGGYVYNTPVAGVLDPYPNAPWDIVFTADDPYSRPDPYRGQLNPYANLYAVTPLAQASFAPSGAAVSATNPNNPTNTDPPGTASDGYDVMLAPLGYQGPTGETFAGAVTGTPPTYTGSIPSPLPAATTALQSGGMSPLAINYFYVIGNTAPGGGTSYELGTPGPAATPTAGNGQNVTVGGLAQGFQAGTGTYAVPVTTLPNQIQSFKGVMDPFTGAAPMAPPLNMYMGVLPALAIQVLPGGNPNPPATMTSNMPSNYSYKLPAMAAGAAMIPPTPTPPSIVGGGASGYYWVCLRRPANLFAPVGPTNPMVVVDSARFSYLDGTGKLVANPTAGGPTPIPSIVRNGSLTTVANYPYSVQRYQPYRGGHAVPAAAPIGSTLGALGGVTPIDSRYGYTEQIVVPGTDSLVMGTQGLYSAAGAGQIYSTPPIYHTLGWANEYEQGSLNSMAEPWDYFVFNDRDFTSVAELLLVPGCPPGLFTKQFVEFAPGYGSITNIFGAVVPSLLPPTGGPLATIQGAPVATAPAGGSGGGGGGGGGPVVATLIQAFTNASTPFGFVYNTAAAVVPPTGAASTQQPRTYPYLNDEFFYTGYGGAINYDGGGQVGGYGGDGWFKMFEFFEVPSQSIGAIGPVASGSNFDWLRNDIKPGQLNLNLIMDEEVFFSIAGHQTVSPTNGQVFAAGPTQIDASDQFTQNLLNFNQIAALPNTHYGLATSTPANPFYMLLAGQSPIPLVVTSTLANGTPATAIPIAGPGSLGGMTATDPISNYFFGLNNPTTPPGVTVTGPFYPNGNSLKTAWVQFLTLRHGGSGFLFGFGQGAVGQNSSVAPAPGTVPPWDVAPGNGNYGTGIPYERPFHSLSYPDIDFTIMRPAALPPSTYTNPAANDSPTVVDLTTTPPTFTYYAGDPGVRNPTLFQGYPTGSYPGTIPSTYPAGTTEFTLTTPWGTTFSPAAPAAIPVRRMFQVSDGYRGSTVSLTAGLGGALTPGSGAGAATTFPSTLVNDASNASVIGDQYLNNLIPTQINATATNVPIQATGALPPVTYTNAGTSVTAALTRNNVDIYWPGGNAASLYDGTPGDAAVTVPLPSGVSNPHLGSTSVTPGSGTNFADARDHPYWRTEQLQRMMNLTTPRTHQYAVWITIGFFEVLRQGDLGMFSTNPTLAFDILGPEIGATNGKNVRFRGFYLVDRLQLTGYNPASSTGYKQAIIYRQRIQ